MELAGRVAVGAAVLGDERLRLLGRRHLVALLQLQEPGVLLGTGANAVALDLAQRLQAQCDGPEVAVPMGEPVAGVPEMPLLGVEGHDDAWMIGLRRRAQLAVLADLA